MMRLVGGLAAWVALAALLGAGAGRLAATHASVDRMPPMELAERWLTAPDDETAAIWRDLLLRRSLATGDGDLAALMVEEIVSKLDESTDPATLLKIPGVSGVLEKDAKTRWLFLSTRADYLRRHWSNEAALPLEGVMANLDEMADDPVWGPMGRIERQRADLFEAFRRALDALRDLVTAERPILPDPDDPRRVIVDRALEQLASADDEALSWHSPLGTASGSDFFRDLKAALRTIPGSVPWAGEAFVHAAFLRDTNAEPDLQALKDDIAAQAGRADEAEEFQRFLDRHRPPRVVSASMLE